MRRGLSYRLGLASALLLVIFALATLRTLWRGDAEMAASDRAFDQGELELALRHARRAATAYVPGAAHVDAAYARLQALGLGAERARDAALATSACARSAARRSRVAISGSRDSASSRGPIRTWRGCSVCPPPPNWSERGRRSKRAGCR